MPRVAMRQFQFTDEAAARSAAESITVPVGFDEGRAVGKYLQSAAASIPPTAEMVSAVRRFSEDGQTVIGWVVNVEADDAEKRAAFAPLAMSERDIQATPSGVALPVREVRNAEIDRS